MIKYVCLDLDRCGYVKYVSVESLSKIDFNNPYKNCEECTSMMVLKPVKRKDTTNDFIFNINPKLQKN